MKTTFATAAVAVVCGLAAAMPAAPGGHYPNGTAGGSVAKLMPSGGYHPSSTSLVSHETIYPPGMRKEPRNKGIDAQGDLPEVAIARKEPRNKGIDAQEGLPEATTPRKEPRNKSIDAQQYQPEAGKDGGKRKDKRNWTVDLDRDLPPYTSVTTEHADNGTVRVLIKGHGQRKALELVARPPTAAEAGLARRWCSPPQRRSNATALEPVEGHQKRACGKEAPPEVCKIVTHTFTLGELVEHENVLYKWFDKLEEDEEVTWRLCRTGGKYGLASWAGVGLEDNYMNDG